MLKAKCAALALCAALIFWYSFQTSALGAMRHGSDLERDGPFRAELREVCHNGTLRPYTRRGELLDRQVCTHMPWNTHELYQMHDHYICDNCGAEEYALQAGKWWWCTYNKAYYEFLP